MVRPNHDLPNLLVGGVRDYADREGIDDSEAHAQLLRHALRDVGILCNNTNTNTDANTNGDSAGE